MSKTVPDTDPTPEDADQTTEDETDQETADQLALRLLTLSELAKRVGRARDDIKAQLERQLSAGDNKKPHIPGQVRRQIGSVTYTKGKLTARVTDLKALTAWSMKNYPESVELVTKVKDWHIKAILDASTAAEEPAHPDGTLDVEGVTVAISDPYITTRTSAKIMDDEWRDLMRNHAGLPEISDQ